MPWAKKDRAKVIGRWENTMPLIDEEVELVAEFVEAAKEEAEFLRSLLP